MHIRENLFHRGFPRMLYCKKNKKLRPNRFVAAVCALSGCWGEKS